MTLEARHPVTDQQKDQNPTAEPEYQPYDGRRLSYSTTFTNPWKATAIQVLEWLTAKFYLLRRVRAFERKGVPQGQEFFVQGLEVMGIELQTPEAQLANIPPEGPVVVVANHPHGLIDGMVLATLIGRVRTDYKILTRSLLTGVPEIEYHMIPVAFPHEVDAVRKNLDMRKESMAHLSKGGVIVLFPAGSVSASETWFGRAIEQDWNPFTAKMVKRSGATVLPIYFPGQNSRWYQMANQISATLRQGLLLFEIKHAFNKPQNPVIGKPILPEELDAFEGTTSELMAMLRERTLALGKS